MTPINLGLFQSDLDADGYKLIGLPTPTVSSDAATKGYVDTHAGGGGGGGTNSMITVNVKDAPYSATGNGSTDDTAAIQAAINAVAALGGGTVFFPRGTYLCNGAFDATTNSILQIPLNSYASAMSGTLCTIALLGETQPQGGMSIIKSTKTGTGTVPSVLAAGAYCGTGILANSQFNFTETYLKNLKFVVPDDPTIGAIRLDVAIRAHLEDVWVQTATISVEPTHGTVGVWMPNSQNGAGIISCDRVFSGGCDTAFRVGEHFRATDIFAYRGKTALELLPANFCSWVNLLAYQCVTDIRFSGYHGVDILLDTEHAQAGSGWFSPGTAIVDPANGGKGNIRYLICETNTGPIAGPITHSGGAYLNLTDFHTGITNIAPSGSFYIGTDARLVPVSGGVKLEARNTGTGTWIEAARWTNP